MWIGGTGEPRWVAEHLQARVYCACARSIIDSVATEDRAQLVEGRPGLRVQQPEVRATTQTESLPDSMVKHGLIF
jgi:hypothetical protein